MKKLLAIVALLGVLVTSPCLADWPYTNLVMH